MSKKFNQPITIQDLKNDTYVPTLTREELIMEMKYVQNDRRNGLLEKLLNLKINYNFDEEFGNEFGGAINDKLLLELTEDMDITSIKSIKDYILWKQCTSLIYQLQKGYITVDEI